MIKSLVIQIPINYNVNAWVMLHKALNIDSQINRAKIGKSEVHLGEVIYSHRDGKRSLAALVMSRH